MNIQYTEAFAEVDMILHIMPKNVIDKIPLSFRKLISDKKSKTYKSSAIDNIFITEENLKEETKSILSVIYRQYLCEPEIREILELSDINELKELSHKYSYDNLFKKQTPNIESIKSLPQIKKEKLYEKFYIFIIQFFKR